MDISVVYFSDPLQLLLPLSNTDLDWIEENEDHPIGGNNAPKLLRLTKLFWCGLGIIHMGLTKWIDLMDLSWFVLNDLEVWCKVKSKVKSIEW